MTTFHLEANAGSGWVRIASVDTEAQARRSLSLLRANSSLTYRAVRLDIVTTVLPEPDAASAVVPVG